MARFSVFSAVSREKLSIMMWSHTCGFVARSTSSRPLQPVRGIVVVTAFVTACAACFGEGGLFFVRPSNTRSSDRL